MTKKTTKKKTTTQQKPSKMNSILIENKASIGEKYLAEKYTEILLLIRSCLDDCNRRTLTVELANSIASKLDITIKSIDDIFHGQQKSAVKQLDEDVFRGILEPYLGEKLLPSHITEIAYLITGNLFDLTEDTRLAKRGGEQTQKAFYVITGFDIKDMTLTMKVLTGSHAGSVVYKKANKVEFLKALAYRLGFSMRFNEKNKLVFRSGYDLVGKFGYGEFTVLGDTCIVKNMFLDEKVNVIKSLNRRET